MYIRDYTEGRNNNFNLVRLVAASLVFVSHSFVLPTGDLHAEPLERWLGITFGTIAVQTFFVTSGFLVAGSLTKRATFLEFLTSRFLRIYPGLWFALALSVSMCGMLSTLRVTEFWQHPSTWRYLGRNAMVVFSMRYDLPGVFDNLPYKTAVNGSLWTLPYEVRMYLILLACWAAAKLGSGRNWFPRLCLYLTIGLYVTSQALKIAGLDADFATLGYMFFAGSALRLWQHRVPMRRSLALGLAALLLLSTLSPVVFRQVNLLAAPWLVLWLALVPGGAIRKINRFGDYSYGIYIYAFPIQQISVALGFGLSPLEMISFCTAPILLCAILSWHLVEKPCLTAKDQAILWLRTRILHATD